MCGKAPAPWGDTKAEHRGSAVNPPGVHRTYAHIAASYEIAESNIYRGIKWVEGTLIRGGTFSLPGRKTPLKSDAEHEVILVDATKSPIERPKKSKSDTIPERKSGIR